METMKNRADFVAASRARREARPAFILQARQRPSDSDAKGVRVGFTCSKKVGNAVARNRAKRRLREVARSVLPELGVPGWDYVMIGRAEVTASHPFELMIEDLRHALAKVHR